MNPEDFIRWLTRDTGPPQMPQPQMPDPGQVLSFLQSAGLENLRGFGTATSAVSQGLIPGAILSPQTNPDMAFLNWIRNPTQPQMTQPVNN